MCVGVAARTHLHEAYGLALVVELPTNVAPLEHLAPEGPIARGCPLQRSVPERGGPGPSEPHVVEGHAGRAMVVVRRPRPSRRIERMHFEAAQAEVVVDGPVVVDAEGIRERRARVALAAPGAARCWPAAASCVATCCQTEGRPASGGTEQRIAHHPRALKDGGAVCTGPRVATDVCRVARQAPHLFAARLARWIGDDLQRREVQPPSHLHVRVLRVREDVVEERHRGLVQRRCRGLTAVERACEQQRGDSGRVPHSVGVHTLARVHSAHASVAARNLPGGQ